MIDYGAESAICHYYRTPDVKPIIWMDASYPAKSCHDFRGWVTSNEI